MAYLPNYFRVFPFKSIKEAGVSDIKQELWHGMRRYQDRAPVLKWADKHSIIGKFVCGLYAVISGFSSPDKRLKNSLEINREEWLKSAPWNKSTVPVDRHTPEGLLTCIGRTKANLIRHEKGQPKRSICKQDVNQKHMNRLRQRIRGRERG